MESSLFVKRISLNTLGALRILSKIQSLIGSRFVVVGIIASHAAVNLLAAPYWSTDFNSSIPPEITGAGALASVEGFAGAGGITGTYLRNDSDKLPTILTLNNLPPHTSIKLGFVFIAADSWDGTYPGDGGTDQFIVSVSGADVFNETLGWYQPSFSPDQGVLVANNANYVANPAFQDAAYNMGLQHQFLNIPHSASTLTVSFRAAGPGWNGGDNESFGLENLGVTLLGGAFITQDPQNRSVVEGQTATFTAAADAANQVPALRWQQSIDNGSNWTDLSDGGSTSGTTTGTLNLTSTTLGMSGRRYRLKATYQSGSIFSAAANLTVTPEIPPTAVLLTTALPWRKAEFRLDNLLSVSNPFDPDVIRVDATFTSPTGAVRTVPAFWYQPFTRGLSGGYENINSAGPGQWRLRFTPAEAGTYAMTLNIQTNGQLWRTVTTNLQVSAAALPARYGFVRNDASNRHFETGDGQPLRLIGANVCWPGARGTLDYDDWFPTMQTNSENFARIWMADWSLGIENEIGTLTNYDLDRAWQLDYVVDLAEQRGIYLMLCLEIDGMFQSVIWPRHPYNAVNGGPVSSGNPNGYFTQTDARKLFQKRLRYLIARYGYSQNLLAWEFFNEVDNSYYLLNPPDIFTWHGVMSDWLHANDPYRHLVTTSLKGGSDEPQLWNLPNIDFACYHSYGEAAFAKRYSSVAQDFMQRYNKPVLIGEFGVSGGGWRRAEEDPYLRGFRQALWGGALGGSVGTAMSWWWENLHGENVYPYYASLGAILNRTGWGKGSWTPVALHGPTKAPFTVGEQIAGGQPFDAQLSLNTAWDGLLDGRFALTSAEASAGSSGALNGFLHGYWHDPKYRLPFVVSAWFTNTARIVVRVKTVAVGAILTVKVDGSEVYRVTLQNRDYNEDFPVVLPAGQHTIELFNPGSDWIYLDWVRFEHVLPSRYTGNWQPPADTIGLKGSRETLLYVTAPGHAFPSYATNAIIPPSQGQNIVLTNWPPGKYFAEWYHPTNGVLASRVASTTTNGALSLPLPDFSEDLAGIVYAPPTLTAKGFDGSGNFRLQLDSETGGKYILDRSTNPPVWTPAITLTNTSGTLLINDPSGAVINSYLYRARKP